MAPNGRVPNGAFRRLLDWRGGLVIRAAPIVLFVAIVVALGTNVLRSGREGLSQAHPTPASTPSLVPPLAADRPTTPPTVQSRGGVRPATKGLVDQSTWWILPEVPLLLLMVLAMLEFTRTLLAKPAPKNVESADAAELRSRLMALNAEQKDYRIVEGKPWDLELDWNVVPASWRERFAKIKVTTVYRARMLLDESRHEVRWFEILRRSSFFIGFNGLVPVFRWTVWTLWGYIDVQWTGLAYAVLPGFPPRIGRVHRFSVNTVAAKQDIRKVVSQCGWSFQPRLWWFQVRRSSDGQVPGVLLARAFPHLSERRFWGILYPSLYVLSISYIFAISGGWSSVTPQNALAILAFSVLWWGIWGGATKLLLYQSEPRRRK